MTALMGHTEARRHYRMVDKYGRSWPLQPLLELTELSLPDIAQRIGRCRRTGWRLAADGWVNDRLADALACAAGLHPVLVWPDWNAGAVEEEP